MVTHAHTLVTRLQDRIAALETEFHHAWWESQTRSDPASDTRRAELELELRRAKGDPEDLAAVNDALTHELHDPLLRRQLEVLRSSLTANQMDESLRRDMVELSTEIESEFNSYRAEVDGRKMSENEIEELLRRSDDADLRRKVWEASKAIGPLVADRIRELARLRNTAARDLGFADFYRMSLELQELPEEWLFEVMDQLERDTREPFQRWKDELDDRLRRRFDVSQLYPWHYADPFFQALPPDGAISVEPLVGNASAAELALKTFAPWGIDLQTVFAQSDLYPRDAKSQHAFCIDIDRTGKDVRILANVVPGERWIEVMLHESGHAAYDVEIDPTLPYLLHRPAHIFVTEAIAILCGRLVRDPQWLVDVAGIAASDIADIQRRVTSATRAQSLLFARWGLVMVHFERELYLDPEADLDALWWELVSRFQLVEAPPDRAAPDWATKIHIGSAPVYYQNYLLGEILASQLAATCERECGGLVGNRDAGQLLVDRIFRKGASQRWDVVVDQAVGERLSPGDFAEALGA